MALPFFYKEDLDLLSTEVVLDEDTSKHITQVLRMQAGEPLQLTDGKGNVYIALIKDANRKKCIVSFMATNHQPQTRNRISIAISLIKNSNRFEWFLEKATELSITEIVPLLCERTEKQHFRFDRMKNILVSAMLQSQQCWLPVLHEPVKFDKVILSSAQQQKFIAHCIEAEKRNLVDLVNESLSSRIILIGPEGDFSPAEIQLAIQQHFIPVTLGDTRLRTETAGIVAATLLSLI